MKTTVNRCNAYNATYFSYHCTLKCVEEYYYKVWFLHTSYNTIITDSFCTVNNDDQIYMYRDLNKQQFI